VKADNRGASAEPQAAESGTSHLVVKAILTPKATSRTPQMRSSHFVAPRKRFLTTPWLRTSATSENQAVTSRKQVKP